MFAPRGRFSHLVTVITVSSAVMACVVTGTFLPGGATSAFALTGSPITVAGGQVAGAPSVAVQPDGTAVIAWANTALTPNVVEWCVLPLGAELCSAGGQLHPAGGAGFIESVSVLDEGTSVNILAGVFGAPSPETYESVQEWQSLDHGATFAPVNGGQAVAAGNPSGITQAVGAVTLPGDSGLGVGFITASEAPSFRTVSLTAPTTCGRGACPDGFATLQPEAELDQVSNPASRNFAANQAGVMGIFGTNFTSGPLACPGTSPFGTAFVLGTGAQGPANNYDLSPGTANSAWRDGVTQGDCDVEYPALGAGPSGFGVLEQNDLTGQTQYHRFDLTNGFGAAPAIVSPAGEREPTVSQDAAGGVYATYLNGGPEGPVSLSYSSDGGTTWTGPNTLAGNPGAIEDLTSSLDGSGQGWAVWVNGNSVLAQRFDKTDAVPPSTSSVPQSTATSLTTTQTSGKQSGRALSITQGTVGETDRATIAGANAAHASGTISYTLYTTSTCRPTSAILRGAPQAVAGPLAPTSVPVGLLLAPGTYYWQAVYSGNAASAAGPGNLPSVSACDESLTVTPAAAISATATSNGKTLTFSASCAAVPCTIKAVLTSSSAAKATAKKKSKPITLGSGTFRVKKKGTRRLTLTLSRAGRRYLAKTHTKVKLRLSLSQKVASHTVVDAKTLSVKVEHSKR